MGHQRSRRAGVPSFDALDGRPPQRLTPQALSEVKLLIDAGRPLRVRIRESIRILATISPMQVTLRRVPQSRAASQGMRACYEVQLLRKYGDFVEGASAFESLLVGWHISKAARHRIGLDEHG